MDPYFSEYYQLKLGRNLHTSLVVEEIQFIHFWNDVQTVFPWFLAKIWVVKPSREPHVRCAYRQTTAITFILRINALPFPLCWHISDGGRADFIFLLQSSSCQNAAFPSPLTLPAAPSLEITHRRASPLSPPPASLHLFSSLHQRKGGWGCVDRAAGLRRARPWRKMRNPDRDPFPSVTIPPRCSVSLPLRFARLGQSAGVWPPQSALSIPACLQLVSSDRSLLIFPRGVRVRHEPFSLQRTSDRGSLWKNTRSGHPVGPQCLFDTKSLHV